MMTALDLRTRITAALAANNVPLGTYKFTTGAQTPAFRVDKGKPQQGVSIEGLEVAVYLNPDIKEHHVMKYSIVLREWLCELKNWGTAPGLLQDAVTAISKEFRLVRFLRFVPASRETMEMVTLRIPE